MKIVIITQNEPFYLAKNLNYLLDILPRHSEVVGCVVNDVSPFGKRESFIDKALKTKSIFGWPFFIYYTWKYIKSKFSKSNNLLALLAKRNIPVITLTEHINSAKSVERIKRYSPDLLVSILGNQIFKEEIITLAPRGCLNLHTALLPKYRGLMPTFWVLKNKEKYTGVSVFFVDEGIDSGPIVVQKKLEIGERTQKELIHITKKIGMEAIAEAVDLIKNEKVVIIPNDSLYKSYYSFPTRKDVKEFIASGKRFY